MEFCSEGTLSITFLLPVLLDLLSSRMPFVEEDSPQCKGGQRVDRKTQWLFIFWNASETFPCAINSWEKGDIYMPVYL